MAEPSREVDLPLLTYTLFAFLSGVTALVYQVVWTRQVALFLGSQIEAISIVLVAFFGGLAAGARYFGARADRVRAPLRLFGILEGAAAALAIASPFLLRWMASSPVIGLPTAMRFAMAAAVLFPISFLLGGTAPALLRAGVHEITRTAAGVGWIVGANSAGAVLGVSVAMALIPVAGLRATIIAAGATAFLVGGTAFLFARPVKPAASPAESLFRIPPMPLAAAFTAGIATLAYEVLAARAAALLLGSTLYAWGCVLALLLAGLALGTALFGHRAGRTTQPDFELGVIECAAAIAIAAGLSWFVPDYALPAAGLSAWTGLLVAVSVFPPALLMGGAFPYLVRLSVGTLGTLGKAFGTVSGVNTAGGIAGSLLAPFVLLPTLGLLRSLLLCACLNGLLGTVFLLRGSVRQGQGWLRASAIALLVALVALPAFRPPTPVAGRRVIHVDEGRQASVAVVRASGGRELIVDGDPEAGTGWDALETEVLLALLPLTLKPEAKNFLEVGLGSGITLGTAARFPLERIDCVEISRSIIDAGRFFEPENGGVTRNRDSRVHIIHGDGRAYLAQQRAVYDVIVANTLHPWSVGATGLYSREYFGRISNALARGGIAVQWVPIARISSESLASILRTFFSVFGAGGVWWGSENLLLVGVRPGPGGEGLPPGELEAGGQGVPPDLLARAGLGSVQEMDRRRLSSAAALRVAVGGGPILADDLPRLETEGARRHPVGMDEEVLELVDRISRAGTREDPRSASMAAWIAARLARARDLDEEAGRLEARAETAGLDLARRSRLGRARAHALEALNRGRTIEAEERLRAVLREEPGDRDARYALATIAMSRNDIETARRELDALVRDYPGFAEGWNTLGVSRNETGDRPGAREAFSKSLEADPYFPEALANAGLTATAAGDDATGRAMLSRLQEISPFGASAEERALAAALGGASGSAR